MRGRKRCTARKHDREPGEAGAAGVEAKFGAAATQVNARVRPPRARPESPPARQQRQCDWQRHIFTDLAPRLLRASRSRGAPPLLLMGLALVGARGALAPPRRAVCRPRAVVSQRFHFSVAQNHGPGRAAAAASAPQLVQIATRRDVARGTSGDGRISPPRVSAAHVRHAHTGARAAYTGTSSAAAATVSTEGRPVSEPTVAPSGQGGAAPA